MNKPESEMVLTDEQLDAIISQHSQTLACPESRRALMRVAIDAARPRRELIESVAKAIYRQWDSLAKYVEWVDGGNSIRQDHARSIAREALAVPSEQPIAEQPKSDKANLMVAVGSDLPPAPSEQPEDYWIRQHTAARQAEMDLRRELLALERKWKNAEADANMYANAWQRELAASGVGFRKRHHIDSMVEATQELVRRYRAAEAKLAAIDSRVEPVVGPLSGARSDLPSMPPPAASLPVSAPAGQEDARTNWIENCAARFKWAGCTNFASKDMAIGEFNYRCREEPMDDAVMLPTDRWPDAEEAADDAMREWDNT